MTGQREFDLVLFGATGFTGRLVAEYLLGRHGATEQLKWGLAGRSREKLEEIRQALGAEDLPVLIADSHDRRSLDALAGRTRVICTTVGPYSLHGSDLVAACAAAGTDYCDLSGEVPWMQQMIDAHGAGAEASGARIVHCCGFDSIPSDLGVWFLQRHARERFGAPLERIRMRVKAARGGLSGGTAASMLHLIEQARRDPDIRARLKNPYALCPPEKRTGVRQPYVAGPAYDPAFEAWTAPFIMAAINTRVVHRTNALSGYAYGEHFRYDEAMLTGRGLRGRLRAYTVSAGMGALALAGAFGPTRSVIRRWVLPAPGEGPSPEAREAGFFKLLFEGRTAGGERLRASVAGDRDPGYGSTAKMLGEAAVALVELDRGEKSGGFWTPASALDGPLLERLQRHAGLSFQLEEIPAG